MLGKGQQLQDEHHVLRHVRWTRLLRDGDDNVLGFLGAAFALKADEEYLSVNWVEFFSGDRQSQINECVNEFRSQYDVSKKSAFGIANVCKIKAVCQEASRPVRIVYSPTPNLESHTSIQKLPRDEMALLEALATEAFTEMVMSAEVPEYT